jgi:AhpD family alkylhydroperoxidase
MPRRIAYFQVAPDAVKALSAARPYIESSGIGSRLRALVELRASQINGCDYCVDLHSRESRLAGESQQRLDCLPVWKETTFFDERERATLDWVESVALVSQTGVPDEIYEQAWRHFSDKELVDLTLIVSIINAWNRIAVRFRHGPGARKPSAETES